MAERNRNAIIQEVFLYCFDTHLCLDLVIRLWRIDTLHKHEQNMLSWLCMMVRQ